MPLVDDVYIEFCQTLRDKQYQTPRLECLTDAIANGEVINSKKNVYGDSISIEFDYAPIRISPIIKGSESTLIMIENGARFFFSMGINGGVLAFIAPQSSEISQTKKKNYLVGEWRNAADMSRSELVKLFKLLFEVQTYCGIQTSGKFAARILTRLSARDESLSSGTNPLFRHIKYLSLLFNGVRKLYGMGTPVK